MDKIQQFNDFVKAIQEVLNNCELTSTQPYKDPDVWKATLKMSQTEYFVMKKNAGHYYFRGLEYVREQLKHHNVTISEGYISNSYSNFIEQIMRTGEDIATAGHTWFNKLRQLQLQQFRLLIPISHYDFRGDIDLGTIKVVQLTDEILRQDFDVKGEVAKTTNASSLIDHNNTNTFAIVNVESLEKEHAEELGYQIVEKFIYATRLIDPGSYIRLRKWSMNQVNEDILVKNGKGFSESMHTYYVPVRVNPGNAFYTKLQPYWNKLASFLYSNSPNDLQQVILSALYWFGETDVHTDSRVKQFLNFLTGLDWIVLNPYGKKFLKADAFGKNCAKIFSGDEKYSEFWEEYYLKRNDITHQKLVEIYKEEIDTLRINLRSLLLQLIDFTDKYNTLTDVFDQEYGIK